MAQQNNLVARRKDPALLLRIPKPLLKKVEAASTRSGRSRNTEILFALEQYVTDITNGKQSAAGAR